VTTGRVVKYIGDASLLVFPEGSVEEAIRELVSMKREIESYFKAEHPGLAITFSAHVGEVIIVRLEPVEGLDILGDTVNRASRLGSRGRRGSFVISRDVYERLDGETRKRFQKAEPEVVYTAG
jgi:class 3 adenylate cyclase